MMTPIAFSNCFGWLHPSTGGLGVVICNPHGYEELSIHRILRNLAEDLSAAGMPTLRFDYLGTGNSVGTDGELEQPEIWIENIREAIDQLCRLTKVERVALVGLRVGALLAMQVAHKIDRVVAVALVAPIHSGKAYVREVKTLARMSFMASSAGNERVASDPHVNLAGFIMWPKLVEQLNALEIDREGRVPAKRVLIMKGQENPADEALAEALRAQGADVETTVFEAYDEMMIDAVFAKKPDDAFLHLQNWLAKDLGGTSVTPEAVPDVVLAEDTWVERPVIFGQDSKLFAVYCAPPTKSTHKLALIFVTTGSNHQIGAGRRSVLFARRLAAMGYASLRMDIAGLGDSPPRPGRKENVLYDVDSIRDVSAAIDWLETQGIDQVILTGVSAGGYLSFHVAIQDPRIIGALPVNSPNFIHREGDSLNITVRDQHHSTRFYIKKLIDAKTWGRFFKGELNIRGISRTVMRRIRRKLRAKIDLLRGLVGGTVSDTITVRHWFKLLQARNTQLLFIYSENDGGLDDLSVYLGRDGKKLQSFKNVKLVMMTGTDHVLTATSAKEEFFQMLVAFLRHCESLMPNAPAPRLVQETVE